MANRAFLIGSNRPGPAGAKAGRLNYDPDTEVLAAASSGIPLLWLALFPAFTNRSLSLVSPAADARALARQRRARILGAFPQCTALWDAWEQLLAVPCQYFKVDAAEIKDLAPAEYGPDLRAALQWFSTGADADLEKLLRMADAPGQPAGVQPLQLRGYHWVRPVPWTEAVAPLALPALAPAQEANIREEAEQAIAALNDDGDDPDPDGSVERARQKRETGSMVVTLAGPQKVRLTPVVPYAEYQDLFLCVAPAAKVTFQITSAARHLKKVVVDRVERQSWQFPWKKDCIDLTLTPVRGPETTVTLEWIFGGKRA